MALAFGSTIGRRVFLLAVVSFLLLYLPAVPVHLFGIPDPGPMWFLFLTVGIAACLGAISVLKGLAVCRCATGRKPALALGAIAFGIVPVINFGVGVIEIIV